jgi:hypothetical protein
MNVRLKPDIHKLKHQSSEIVYMDTKVLLAVVVFIAVAAFVALNFAKDNKWAIQQDLKNFSGEVSTVGQTKPECDAAHVGTVFGNEKCVISGETVKCLDKGCTSQSRTINYAWHPKS